MNKCKHYVKENGSCRKFTNLHDSMDSIKYCIESPCPYEESMTNFELIKSMNEKEMLVFLTELCKNAQKSGSDVIACIDKALRS